MTMKTHFASPERADYAELRHEIERICENPVIDGLMRVMSGLLAVLNEHRQILALNETFLKLLGIGKPENVLGLRIGESVGCVHAHEMPGGCGTSSYCSTCGVAIAMVTSLGTDTPCERTCAITIEKNDKNEDLYFRVRSCPVVFGDRRVLLLFLHDMTKQQQWAALEEVFFHDINNIVQGVLGKSELLNWELGENACRHARDIRQLSLRLAKEIAIQQTLFRSESHLYQPSYRQVTMAQVIGELRNVFSGHVAAKDKLLVIPETIPELSFETDLTLLIRILRNMITNAFEATDHGGEVRLEFEHSGHTLTFYVRNQRVIPADIAKRIFQRNFSTKQEIGRGLGTYSMKLFGEQVLGGKVDFETSEAEGTKFCFRVKI